MNDKKLTHGNLVSFMIDACLLASVRLWNFFNGGSKLVRFLVKNQHDMMKGNHCRL